MIIVTRLNFLFRLFLFMAVCGVSQGTHASVARLLITEVMANPSAVSDTNGEWFELYNPTAVRVDLEGLLLSDDGSNSHTIASGGNLWIAPGEYFVLGRNGDPLVNGGFRADYVYGNFTLGNTSDQIVLTDDAGEQLRLNYGSGFVGDGRSTELVGLPMDGEHYALTDVTRVYGSGDIGTPGVAGAFEPSPVPVPAAAWLFCSGLAGMVGFSRRKRRTGF